MRISEALAAGSWAIGYDKSGCAVDLLSNPNYGTIFQSGDKNELIQAMRSAYDRVDEINLGRYSVASKSALELGIGRSVDAFVNAIQKAAK